MAGDGIGTWNSPLDHVLRLRGIRVRKSDWFRIPSLRTVRADFPPGATGRLVRQCELLNDSRVGGVVVDQAGVFAWCGASNDSLR